MKLHAFFRTAAALFATFTVSASAHVVNIDFNNTAAGTYSGQGAYSDTGNDYWNAPSLGTGTPSNINNLTASDGSSLTLASLSITYTGSHERTGYTQALLKDGAVHVSELTIRGLDDNETYDFYLYSTFNNFRTTFTVGTSSVTVEGSPVGAPYQENFIEGETWGKLTGLTPSGGEITVTVAKKDASATGTFVSGIQIVGNIPEPQPSAPSPSEVINVDFNKDSSTTYSGQGALVDDSGNTHWNGFDQSITSASNLTASNGTTSSKVGFTFSNQGSHLRVGYTNEMLKDCRVQPTGVTTTLSINGLDNDKTYTIYLYSTFDTHSTDFTINGVTGSVTGAPNTATYEEGFIRGKTYTAFTGISPSGGQIDIDLTSGTTSASGHTATSSGSVITGFQIAPEARLGRILCIGDSITEANALRTPDGDGNWSWRYWFWQNLVDFEVPYEFVGTRTANKNGSTSYPAYENESFVNKHDAIWGTSALNRANNAPTYLGKLATAGKTPDTAIIFLGGNDMPVNLSLSAATVRNRIKAIVDNLQGDLGTSGNPDMRILILSILPRYTGATAASRITSDVRNTRFEEINDLLETLATAETTTTSSVEFLDLEPLFNTPPGLLYDGVHPSGDGEQLIGNAVFAALVPNMPDVELTIDSNDNDTGVFNFMLRTHGPRNVSIEWSPDLSDGSWTPISAPSLNPGEWSLMSITESTPLAERRFYRAVIE